MMWVLDQEKKTLINMANAVSVRLETFGNSGHITVTTESGRQYDVGSYKKDRAEKAFQNFLEYVDDYVWPAYAMPPEFEPIVEGENSDGRE